jgi:ribosomal protein S19
LVPGLFLTFSAKVDGGKSLKKFQVSDFQIGRRLGEFALTRKPYFFPMRKKKK